MTPEVYEALRTAITLARAENVLTASVLRSRLQSLGHKAEDVTEALIFWANYLKRTRGV